MDGAQRGLEKGVEGAQRGIDFIREQVGGGGSYSANDDDQWDKPRDPSYRRKVRRLEIVFTV